MSGNPVRVIGSVTDTDGCELTVGVDHDLVTYGTPHVPAAWGRLDREQRVALFRLQQDAAVAVAQYERGVQAAFADGGASNAL